MRQEPRLQFTKEERADPALEKPIRKADRAADKAEKARAKIPKKKIRFEETVTDPATGKTVTRLRFEEVDKKKPPSKLSHAVRDAPGNAILSKVHKEIRESEEDMDELSADLQAKAVGVRTFPTGFEALVKTEDIGSFTALDIEPATIDEIVVFTSKKGEDYE